MGCFCGILSYPLVKFLVQHLIAQRSQVIDDASPSTSAALDPMVVAFLGIEIASTLMISFVVSSLMTAKCVPATGLIALRTTLEGATNQSNEGSA